ANQDLCLDQRADTLLEEDGIAPRLDRQKSLQGPERSVQPKESSEQHPRRLRGQRVQAELRVDGLAPPSVLVLGTIRDEEQHADRGDTVYRPERPTREGRSYRRKGGLREPGLQTRWLPSRLIPHRHRTRAELQPAHELQVDTL